MCAIILTDGGDDDDKQNQANEREGEREDLAERGRALFARLATNTAFQHLFFLFVGRQPSLCRRRRRCCWQTKRRRAKGLQRRRWWLRVRVCCCFRPADLALLPAADAERRFEWSGKLRDLPMRARLAIFARQRSERGECSLSWQRARVEAQGGGFCRRC